LKAGLLLLVSIQEACLKAKEGSCPTECLNGERDGVGSMINAPFFSLTMFEVGRTSCAARIMTTELSEGGREATDRVRGASYCQRRLFPLPGYVGTARGK